MKRKKNKWDKKREKEGIEMEKEGEIEKRGRESEKEGD